MRTQYYDESRPEHAYITVFSSVLIVIVRCIQVFFIPRLWGCSDCRRNRNMKKKVLIIYPDEWVAYSPTILNLVDVLASSFSVKVIAVDTGRF